MLKGEFLHHRVEEAFDAPLACMIKGPGWKGGLAAIGGELDNPAATLLAQVRKGHAHHLDRSTSAAAFVSCQAINIDSRLGQLKPKRRK
jgi:hypothetical protein